ncbi:CATRA conflict system CASPASE/TPR repeat-associated protein [Streptomyces sp. NPDC053069]|uniref:CATRA conflict system CASPASE/TPR repeat-associated protein n=1 Tax=Streptomyces sp. NPDC053069 TaxID=3365695 RepID=UPI0037D986DE
MSLNEQSLVVHLHTSVTPERDGMVPPGLRALWDRFADTLGMAEPALATCLPERIPTSPDSLPDDGAVAARRDPRDHAQAVLRRSGDLLVVSVALSGADWQEMERRWEAAAQGVEEWAWGEARLFVAYADGGRVSPRELAAALPSVAGGTAVLSAAVRLHGPRATLWETDGADDRRLRRLVAVAPRTGDLPERLERWLWYERAATVPPFARYLGHAAKARLQMRVLTATPAPRTADLAEEALARVGSGSTPGSPSRTVSEEARELTSTRHRLLTALSGPGGLSQQLMDLREMQQTVQIAVSNMETSAPAGGPLADDRAVTQWFQHRLADAVAYLELDRERLRDLLTALTVRAEEVIQLGREELQRREAALQLRQQRVNLLQTALIGAFLMVLTAIQAFGYRLRFLPQSAVPALIALLGTLALWLSTLVIALLAPGSPGWQRHFGGACTGFVTASLAWLATAVGSVLAAGRPAPVVVTLPVAAVWFALGWWAMRRYTAGYGNPTP